MAESTTQKYDVIVVGSGASGGWACKRLAESGLKVALLEAGRPQSSANFSEHTPAFELKYRNLAPEIVRKTRPIQSQMGDVCNEYTQDWFVNDIEEPYTAPADKPFNWLGRLRMTGGRTNVWGRVSLRFSDWDFKAASHDGYGEDWPISYKDIAPYYDLVEKYVGITGMAEGLEELPDGQFQPPMALNCQESVFRDRVKQKMGRTATLTRSANLTQSLNGRGPCHYCGPCERGCVTKSYFNSAFTTVADALKSGNCTLISNAMAFKVLMDADRNRARGVLYIDRITRVAARNSSARRHLVRAIARIHPHPFKLGKFPVSQWPRELQRRSRSLPHGPRTQRRWQGRISRACPSAFLERSRQALGDLYRPLSQHERQPALQEIPSRLWL